jgi:hypothetical protein
VFAGVVVAGLWVLQRGMLRARFPTPGHLAALRVIAELPREVDLWLLRGEFPTRWLSGFLGRTGL